MSAGRSSQLFKRVLELRLDHIAVDLEQTQDSAAVTREHHPRGTELRVRKYSLVIASLVHELTWRRELLGPATGAAPSTAERDETIHITISEC